MTVILSVGSENLTMRMVGKSPRAALPVFLRGAKRSTYKDAVADLKNSLCPAAQREHFYSEFDNRALRSGEDPKVYEWELENLLTKADPDLSIDAKSALVQRQFMRSLPNPIKPKLLEHNRTPNFEEMLAYTTVSCNQGLHITWEFMLCCCE